MTTTNVDRLVEEVQAEFFDKFISPTIPGTLGATQVDHIRLWFEKRLPSALSQARQGGREEAVEKLRLIFPMAKGWAHEHDVGSNKKYIEEVKNYLSALTTEGK